MIFRNLDSNGDWEFGRGKQDMTSGNTAIGLNIKTRLYSWIGDCFFDLPAGIDWNNRIGKQNQKTLLELDLRRVVLQSEGVTGINSFDTSMEGRQFTADFSVNTVYTSEYVSSIVQEF